MNTIKRKIQKEERIYVIQRIIEDGFLVCSYDLDSFLSELERSFQMKIALFDIKLWKSIPLYRSINLSDDCFAYVISSASEGTFAISKFSEDDYIKLRTALRYIEYCEKKSVG